MSRAYHFPRAITPELIEIGDKIRVAYKPVDGVSQSREGTVHTIQEHGAMRILATREGGRLLTYTPGERAPVAVLLLARLEVQNMALWSEEHPLERL